MAVQFVKIIAQLRLAVLWNSGIQPASGLCNQVACFWGLHKADAQPVKGCAICVFGGGRSGALPDFIAPDARFCQVNGFPKVDFCRVQNGAKDFGGCTKPCAHTLIPAGCKMVQIGAVGAQPLASGRQASICVLWSPVVEYFHLLRFSLWLPVRWASGRLESLFLFKS
jgi:hypothetical protein